MPHVEHIEKDLSCARCGNQLRGQPINGRCSNCGQWVLSSVRASRGLIVPSFKVGDIVTDPSTSRTGCVIRLFMPEVYVVEVDGRLWNMRAQNMKLVDEE